jgi:hypothetical protein
MLRLLAGSLALSVLMTGTVRAGEPSPDRIVRDLFQRSVLFYQSGSFADAAVLLRAAATIDARPVLIYNLARACERGNDRRCAIDAYKRYLDAMPHASDRSDVDERLRRLALPADAKAEPKTNVDLAGGLKDPFAGSPPTVLEPIGMLPDDRSPRSGMALGANSGATLGLVSL